MPQSETLRSISEEDTLGLGASLGLRLSGIVLLHGDLGAGKTTLVRGIVSAIPGTQPEEVSSPTFTLIHDYGAGVFHIDLYRLEEPREIDTLGLEDIFDQARLVLIEWGEKLGSRAPARRTEITLELTGDQERLIQIVEMEE